jgi:hypothetical protein
MFQPSDAAGNTAAVLHYVQVAAPWSGSGTVAGNEFTGLGSYASDGGVLKLNYQGPTYDVTSGNYTAVPVEDVNNETYDFQFYPPPKKSSLFPLQLPTRAVVDIGASGVASELPFVSRKSDTPVMVTFTPTGEVDRIYHGAAPAGEELDEPVYLLVGKPGKTSYSENDTETNNLLDGENIWIKVDPRTGAVSSAENNPAVDVTNLEQALKDARTWAEGN